MVRDQMLLCGRNKLISCICTHKKKFVQTEEEAGEESKGDSESLPIRVYQRVNPSSGIWKPQRHSNFVAVAFHADDVQQRMMGRGGYG